MLTLVLRVLPMLAIGLGGCGVLAFDIDKGTSLGDIDLGGGTVIHRRAALPSGRVGLVIAVPGIKCAPAHDATTLRVRMKGEGAAIEESLKFGDLTWGSARESCDGWGYIYTKSHGTKTYDLAGGEYQVTIEVYAPATTQVRTASVWAIYGDMVPTIRMFGSTAR